MSSESPGGQDSDRGPVKADPFDIRTIIGVLLGGYGVVLVVMGLVGTSEADLAKADGFNINLWGGLGMLAAGICFVIWARVRPIMVPAQAKARRDRDGGTD